jgi:hypothetical protein
MEHGAFNMIPKANNKVCNENIDISTTQDSPHTKITNEVSFFDMNSFHQAKQSTKRIMWK